MSNNIIGVNDFEFESAKIEVLDNDEEGISVIFHGKINMQNPTEIFGPFFKKLHESLVEKEIEEVIADFTDLQFLNSSGLKTIIRWLMDVDKEDEDDQYLVRVLYSSDIGWQETSLTTFEDLVPDIVEAEEV